MIIPDAMLCRCVGNSSDRSVTVEVDLAVLSLRRAGSAMMSACTTRPLAIGLHDEIVVAPFEREASVLTQ
jgi:hypothetical protein